MVSYNCEGYGNSRAAIRESQVMNEWKLCQGRDNKQCRSGKQKAKEKRERFAILADSPGAVYMPTSFTRCVVGEMTNFEVVVGNGIYLRPTVSLMCGVVGYAVNVKVYDSRSALAMSYGAG